MDDQTMKRLLGFLFSWRFGAIVVCVLLAAMVWMVGPMLDVGGLRPLDEAIVRVALISLLFAALVFWLSGWPLWIVSMAALSTLVWFGGPMAAIGEFRPLAEVGVRVGVISVIVLLSAIYGLYRLFRLLRTDEALLRRILAPKRDEADRDASSEVRAVRLVVSKAVGQIKRLRAGPQGWRRLLESKRYLYDLPWYMIIGTPGAGKTTAILNSGLDFPMAEQMGVASLPGAGGTVNCDWWFTNEAVLIDTAGRYSDQDEQGNAEAAQVNAAEWQGFLGALRKHRTRAPINGVILAVSVAELLEQPGDNGMLASILRARLADVRQALGIRFPVYVLVTKLDLLPGFDEYFQAMTAEGRSQVWGFTLDYALKESSAQPFDLRTRFDSEFQLLSRRLEDCLNARLVEEYGAVRRKRLYPFPQEFRGLARELTDLLSKVFLDSRYDDVQIQRMLRGVYLSSARQAETVVTADRNSLFERLRRTLGRLYGGEGVALTSAGREPALMAHRSYFLRNLFKQVMIPESHLVRPNRKWILAQGVARWGVHLASAGLMVWLVSGMVASRANNTHYLAAVGQKAEGVTQRAAQVPAGTLDSQGVRLLTDAATMAQVEGLDLDAPPLDYRYGLYAAPPVDSAAQETYSRMLRKHLLPTVDKTLETALRSQVAGKDTEGIYGTLGLYLSLYDTRYFEPDTLIDWVKRQWARSRHDSEREKSQLDVHLHSLFGTGYEALPQAEQDAALVEQARSMLQERPDATRMYERAMRALEAAAPARFTLHEVLGASDAALFSDHAADGESGVPGIFTYAGYRDVFRKRVSEFIDSVWSRESWMLGRQNAGDDNALAGVQDARRGWLDKERIEREVQTLFLRDYAAHWERYINQIRLVSGFGAGDGPLAVDVATLRALAATNSPLARLGFALSRQTTLSADADASNPAASAAIQLAAETAQRRSSTVARASDALNKLAVDFDQDKLAEELVDKRFSALREMVMGSPNPGPIDPVKPGAQLQQVLQLINDQYTQMAVASNALASASMPPPQETSPTLFLTAETLPAPFKRILAGLSQRAANQLGRETGILLSEQVNAAVGGICRSAISGKFPFSDSDQEVDPDDFVQLFAAGGVFDATFQRSLASYVDTSSSPWRYKSTGPGMRPIQGPDLQPFERAADIRKAFFDGAGNRGLHYRLTGSIVSVDPAITELLLDVDGESLRYVHGPVSPFSFAWPGPRSGSHLELSAKPRVTTESSSVHLSGPWAPLRLLQHGRVTATASSGRSLVDFDFDGRHAVLEIGGGRKGNFLTGSLLRGFRCPGGTW